jgi:hypothetical protein
LKEAVDFGRQGVEVGGDVTVQRKVGDRQGVEKLVMIQLMTVLEMVVRWAPHNQIYHWVHRF